MDTSRELLHVWEHAAFNSPWVSIIVVNKERTILAANDALCKLAGYSREELVGKNTLMLYESVEKFNEFFALAFSKILNGESANLRFQFRQKNGNLRWVRMTSNFLAAQGHVLWNILDINDAVLNEQRLEQSNLESEALASIVQHSTNDIFIANYDTTRYLYGNDRALKTLGYTLEEFTQLTSYDVNTELTEERIQELKNIFNTQGSVSFEALHTRKDGSTYQAQVSVQLVTYKGQKSYVIFSNDITKRKEAEAELMRQKELFEHQANHDSLTGLPNRVLFIDRLHQAIKKANRNDTKIAVLFIDLDHFKEINDSLGHDIGDKVLIEVTKRMAKQLRQSDTIARLGGDEFCVILENFEQIPNLDKLIKNGINISEEPIIIDDQKLYASLSIGISIYPDDAQDEFTLLKNADAAMYKAKRDGRNTYEFYNHTLTEQALKRIQLESDIRSALIKEEFEVYYQPQINIQNHTIVGMEALIRWIKPDNEVISPITFIPQASESGLIIKIDKWVMKQAMTKIVEWYALGLNPGRVAINLSMKLLQERTFYSYLTHALEETGCRPEWIELEITEGQLMTNLHHAVKILTKLNALGISIAVDDFGTGYSSLSYLKRLPINKLKIDRSFIINIPDNKEDNAIAQAIIAMGKALNLQVIAEGVELETQKAFLLENSCTLVQGFFYAKALPKESMQTYLETFNT